MPEGHIYFQPRDFSDFVIHYRGWCYHTHKLLLAHHSQFFFNYCSAYNKTSQNRKKHQEDDGYGNINRKRLREETKNDQTEDESKIDTISNQNYADDICPLCHESAGRCCITFNDDQLSGDDDGSNLVRLFLHMYDPIAFCIPPFMTVRAEVKLQKLLRSKMNGSDVLEDIEYGENVTTASFSCFHQRPEIEFSQLSSLSCEYTTMKAADPSDIDSAICLQWRPSFLALLQYLDCSTILMRCQEMLIAVIDDIAPEGYETGKHISARCARAVRLLPFASRYHLDHLKEKCLSVISSDPRWMKAPACKESLTAMSKEETIEMIAHTAKPL